MPPRINYAVNSQPVVFQVGDTVLQHSRSTLAKRRPAMHPGTAVGNGPASVGADLRAARERLGWALPDAAATLRIKLAYLEGIESGNIVGLPSPAYALGFLRTYARALGLNPEEQVRRFKAVADEVTRPTELDFPAPVADRQVPAGAFLLLAAVLAIGAYAVWYQLSAEGRLPAEVVQPVPERLAPLAQQALPPRPAPPQASAVVPSPQQAVVAPPEPALPELPSVPPTSAAAAMPIPPVAAASPQNPDDSRIVLRAKSDSWLQVRERGGQVLLNRVLRSGETWAVPNKPNLLLSTGNAGGTDVLVDGTPAPSMGGPGVVRRDQPLDADAMRDGKSPAQQQAATQGPAVKSSISQ